MEFITARNETAREQEEAKDLAEEGFVQDEVLLSLDPEERLYLVGAEDVKRPVLSLLLREEGVKLFFSSLPRGSYFLKEEKNRFRLFSWPGKKEVRNVFVHEVSRRLAAYLTPSVRLDEEGNEVIDDRREDVAPHFSVNLLLGNRIGYPDPLLSTPKSVVTRLGGGSFRAQAGFQVLATTWGLSPEENGHPTNRQFYLLEDGRILFYSGSVQHHVRKAVTTHGRNKTVIEYELFSGLSVRREIFLLPQEEGLPEACEVQRIRVKNKTSRKRTLSIVATGMFGFSNPDCQKEDVVYSTLVSQAQILLKDKIPIALSPDYYPEYFKRQRRFVLLRGEDSKSFTSFSTDYAKFLGNGSLEEPEGIPLDNRLSRIGPNFFALGRKLTLKPLGTFEVDTFTGAVNAEKTQGDQDRKALAEALEKLIETFPDPASLDQEEKKMEEDLDSYSSFLRRTDEEKGKNYFNRTLPFQVRYQTFVSRSFSMTQKGYREIGFREIQDLYASMPYLLSAYGKETFLSLLTPWIENVYPFGYVNHNFYYVGKEPGMCSDDGLWLFPIVHEYVRTTQDISVLSRTFKMAGSDEGRPLYDTLKAILRYSGLISTGKNGFPLLDRADWNDCLRIDPDYLDGPAKEKKYKALLASGSLKDGDPLPSDLSESVMDAFLLVIAEKDMVSFAKEMGKDEDARFWSKQEKALEKRLHERAYIEGYYARVMLNRKDAKVNYLGSFHDGLSLDPEIDGTFYLNSFSWSILSGVATEKERRSMLSIMDRYLKTPFGMKLCTLSDLSRAGAKDSATDHYFPGDRENGGVFKHAMMMNLVSLLRWAKEEEDPEIARKIQGDIRLEWSVVLPENVLKDPWRLEGNPRFCTQYNNSVTGRNVGPILSGTASWLTLAYRERLGIPFGSDRMVPYLFPEEGSLSYERKVQDHTWTVRIHKKKGSPFDPSKELLLIDGVKPESFDLKEDGRDHSIDVYY